MERHGVIKAIVFGSVARGEPSPRSDVDLIVVTDTDQPFFQRGQGMQYDVFNALDGPAADLPIYTPAELERMADRRFIARALAEGKVIYEHER